MLPVLPPLLNRASRHNPSLAVTLSAAVIALSGNGEAPASLSLALTGGFGVAPSTGLHSPGSLLDAASAY